MIPTAVADAVVGDVVTTGTVIVDTVTTEAIIADKASSPHSPALTGGIRRRQGRAGGHGRYSPLRSEHAAQLVELGCVEGRVEGVLGHEAGWLGQSNETTSLISHENVLCSWPFSWNV